MKKIKLTYGLFISLMIFTSCSSNDDGNSNNNSNIELNPPAWIQGVWVNERYPNGGFKFTSNNMIRITFDANNNIIEDFNFKEFWSIFDNAYVNESTRNNYYKAGIGFPENPSYKYTEFYKTSESTFTLSPGADDHYNKQ
jgi:hypothetical protein